MELSPEDVKFILEICRKRRTPCACLLRYVWAPGEESPRETAGHRFCALQSVPGLREAGCVPIPSRAALHPPSYSPLNLLSWYQVNAPLLDSTQIPPVLRRPAPVLPPVTAAPVSDVKRNLYCHSYHPFTLFPAGDTLVVFLPEPQPTPAPWHSPDLHALISLNKFKSCCSRALKM